MTIATMPEMARKVAMARRRAIVQRREIPAELTASLLIRARFARVRFTR
jgi:hypothetical protein